MKVFILTGKTQIYRGIGVGEWVATVCVDILSSPRIVVLSPRATGLVAESTTGDELNLPLEVAMLVVVLLVDISIVSK